MFYIRYLGALSYDVLVQLVLFFVVTAFILFFNQGQAIPPSTHWYQLTLFGIAMVYYFSSMRLGGQTLGMRAWRFKLSTLIQDKPSNLQIVLRILYFIPSILIAPFLLKSSYALLNQWTETCFVVI